MLISVVLFSFFGVRFFDSSILRSTSSVSTTVSRCYLEREGRKINKKIMWSDDDAADSILESIGHAESVMSERDASETYDRSLQVMIGSLSRDSFDHVLDTLNSPSKQSFLSDEVDNVGKLKFEHLCKDKDTHNRRIHRASKKKRKSPRRKKSSSKRKSFKKTNKNKDEILFSHFRAKAVLFRRWKSYTKKRKLVRKVIGIFEMSARKGKLYRACVKWMYCTMASREYDRELHTKLERVRNRGNVFRTRSFLLRWRHKFRSRNETARIVSEKRRESVLRCFLRIWTSRVRRD